MICISNLLQVPDYIANTLTLSGVSGKYLDESFVRFECNNITPICIMRNSGKMTDIPLTKVV